MAGRKSTDEQEEFHGGPVAGTLHSHCEGCRFNSGRELRSCKPHGVVKKREKVMSRASGLYMESVLAPAETPFSTLEPTSLWTLLGKRNVKSCCGDNIFET